jgi:hypothetical protein
MGSLQFASLEKRHDRRGHVLLIDETSLRRGPRYDTVIMNGDTGETLGLVAHDRDRRTFPPQRADR